MGQSTDAYFFYGYVWTDEHSLFEDSNEGSDEWNEILAVRRGHQNPWHFYRSSGAEAEHNALPYKEQDAAYKKWANSVGFEAMLDEWKSVTRDINFEYSVDVSSHCSCDYPMPYINIRGSEFVAWRGDATEIPLLDCAQAPLDDWNGDLDRFATDLNIDLSDARGPGWFLVSNWC